MANDGNWSLYAYEPNKPAPIAFAILLAIIGAYQIYQSFFRYRWKKFGAVMLWATTVWISGFVCRAYSVYHVQNVNMFIAQFVLIIVGPPLYSASEYFILGRLMAYLPYHAPIHPGRVLSTFVLLSAVVESLTANGAANSAGTGRTPSQVKNGLNCLKAALILQCFVEAFFFSMVATVEYRCRQAKNFPHHIRMICYILYITSFMVLVRCIVRTIEGFEAAACNANPSGPPNHCGYISNHEEFLWVFEIANITLFVILLAIFHPGKYLPRSSRIFLDPADGKTERVGPGFGKADKRPLLVTIIDPFNLYGIITGKGLKVDKFWEVEQPLYEGGELPKKGKEVKYNKPADASIVA
jgi:hypothetical protein